jgi:NAD(P)-dependent dehydrogenase (short-subunit alcohol dehydrogenase family)
LTASTYSDKLTSSTTVSDMGAVVPHAIVTGATSGIGEAVARRLAAGGAGVTLIGRDPERLNRACERIVEAVPSAHLVPERVDLSLMDDVRALAERLAGRPAPDVVISNAAVIAPLDDLTPEGFRRTVAVNHLAPYLLLRLLADRIGTRSARFVVVAADPQRLARLPVDVDDLRLDRPGDWPTPPELWPFAAYALTKNMNTMFVYALARRLRGTSITVNGAHPGIVAGTGLGADLDPDATRLFLSTAEVDPAEVIDVDSGADTPAWLATSTEVTGVTGEFFVERAEVTTAPHTTDVARGERLWEESARLTGLV